MIKIGTQDLGTCCYFWSVIVILESNKQNIKLASDVVRVDQGTYK